MKNILKKSTRGQGILIILLAIAMIGTDILLFCFDKLILGIVGIAVVVLIGCLIYKSIKHPED